MTRIHRRRLLVLVLALALVSGAVALVLARSGRGGGPEEAARAAPATIEEAWSRLLKDVNARLRGKEPVEVDQDRCFRGAKGARLTVLRSESPDPDLYSHDLYTYAFGRACGLDAALALVDWQDDEVRIVRGAGVARSIPAVRDLTWKQVPRKVFSIARSIRRAHRATGAYPTRLAGDRTNLAPDRYRYEAGEAGFRICLRATRRTQWAAYDSAAPGGLVAVGDSGPCSFTPAPAGSLDAVRRDLAVVVESRGGWDWSDDEEPEFSEGSLVAECTGTPSRRELRSIGALGPGNRLAGCVVTDLGDAVTTEAFCVQHGEDGPWALYDDFATRTTAGEGGECDFDPAWYGPY